MKIVIFIHSLSSGGAERVTANLSNYWAQKGWTLTIVTTAGQNQDFYDLQPSIQRIALDLDKSSSNIASAIFHNIQRVLALRTVLKEMRPDIALGMMSTANCLLALAAIGTGITTVGSERIYPPCLPIGRVWSWLRRRSYPLLTAVVVQTEESLIWIKSHTGARRVKIIPNPVTYPLEVCSPRIMPKVSKMESVDQYMLLAVGRLAPQKGLDRLVNAFAELAPRFPNWRLSIVGEGSCRSELESQVSELGLTGRISMPGEVGNVGEWYEAADLYVMTSRFEGFPNTLAEAMAHGLPVVSVDCQTGPRDILRHEVDGLLVAQDDRAALVKALEQFMMSEDLCQQYASRAAEVRERFALNHVAGVWEALFTDLQVATQS